MAWMNKNAIPKSLPYKNMNVSSAVGVVSVVGGLIGFSKGSKASLIMGGLIGILYLYAGQLIAQNSPSGPKVALFASVLLLAGMAKKALKGAPVAVVMCSLALVSLGVYAPLVLK